MEEATVKLLEECSQGCKMAVNSMEQVEKYATGSKLSDVLREYKDKHRMLNAKTEQMLKKDGRECKEPGAMASAFSWATAEMKMKLKGDDTQISKLMMDGCNMGIQSISGCMNQYPTASRESMSLAKELVQTEEDFMKELKDFL